MLTVQRVYEVGGSACITINARVADELGLEAGDLIEIDIRRVKSLDGAWENVED